MIDTYLDRADRRILSILQRDCLTPAEHIAEKIGQSASSILRRIKKLRAEGVIQGQISVLDEKKLGIQLTFVTALEIEREQKERLQQLKKWLDREGLVQQAFYTTGTADVYLIIVSKDVESYDEMTQRLVAEIQTFVG